MEIRQAMMPSDGPLQVAVEWERELEGKTIGYSVESGAGREETLKLVKSLRPLGDAF